MHSSIASFQWLLYIFTVISSLQVSAVRFKIPRLSPTRGTILQNPEILSATISEDFQTFYYNQTLDHFNYRPESYSTFQQRYVINFKYWGGGAGADANAPIFVYLGAEEALDGDISVIGFLTDNAARFNALLVYIEHRYYGKSIPFGSREEALKNASTLGYFNSAQAITDYAAILLYIKEKYNARHSPVIVVGGSYGGSIDNTTMFPPDPFDLSNYIDDCKKLYGVSPRPHWVTTYYGGYDIKLILQRFASNIIFSNGLRDPYSSGGVLEDISESVVAIHTVNGSHCLDILRANQGSDPDWLVMQRKAEVEIIEGWISKYYADLKAVQ
ncbi:hypothetical protein WN943_026181 [Citrus x changshan-huyou]